MADTVYPQSYPFRTMTVRDLMAKLAALDPDAPVIFKAPQYGAFGSGQTYSIDNAEAVHMERREHYNPPAPAFNEDTGEEYMTEADTQVWEEWRGVVIG
jgi:hypothetical protein